MFNPLPQPPSTDDVVNQTLGLPQVKTSSAPAAPPPAGSINLSALTAPTVAKPAAAAAQPKRQEITEDTIISMMGQMAPEQAELFMYKLQDKLRYVRYKPMIFEAIESKNMIVNPVSNVALIVLEKEDSIYTCTLIQLDKIQELIENPEAYVTIVQHTSDRLGHMMQSWYNEVSQVFISSFVANFVEFTGKTEDAFFGEGSADGKE
jgi:hypothetical protein